VIFVTVGTQLPFDRLIESVDLWAKNHPEVEFIIQSGGGGFNPLHCEKKEFVSPVEWERLFSSADLVVSHAGMGTIIKSIDAGKPLIVMPRKASLNEHRNDHQLATAGQLKKIENIVVVDNEKEFYMALDTPPVCINSGFGRDSDNLCRLLDEIKSFVIEGDENA